MQKFLLTVRKEFWILGGVLLIFFGLGYGLWLGPTHIVIHDTLKLYEFFQYTYVQLSQAGTLPQWLPYVSYGVPNYLNDIDFAAPFDIPAMWLAVQAHLHDTWRLYQLTLFADVVVFAIGFYVLAREYVGRLAAGIALAAIVWTLVLQMNSSFVLQLVEFTPFVILFLLRWARSGDPVQILFAVQAAAIGSWRQWYFAVAFAYLYMGITIVFAYFYRPPIRWPRGLNFWLLLPVTVFLVASIAYLASSAIGGIEFHPPGRDTATLRISLHTFLTYGGGGFFKTLEALTAVPWQNVDALFYLGSLGLVFLLYAIWRVRSRDAYALFILFAVTLIFCWGLASPVAALSFYLPGMGFVRHTGLVYAVPRLLGALIAALGIEHFVARAGTEALASGDGGRIDIARLCGWTELAAWVAILFFFLVYPWDFGSTGTDRPRFEMAALGLAASVLIGLEIMRLLATYGRPRWLLPGFVLVLLGQAGAYQAFYGYDLFQRSLLMARGFTAPPPRPFEETRVSDPRARTNPEWYRGFFNQPAAYVEVGEVLNFDSCTPVTRDDYATEGVYELVRRTLDGAKGIMDLHDYFKARPDDPLLQTLGCGVSKLQWVGGQTAEPLTPEQQWPPSCARAAACLENPQSGQRLVLKFPGGRPPHAKTAAEQGITIGHFDLNRLVLTVTPPAAGWLIYADAYHQLWRAEIDGRAAPIWKSNFAFKALPLAAGTHRVIFTFGNGIRNRVYWLAAIIGTAAFIIQLWLAISNCGSNPKAAAKRKTT